MATLSGSALVKNVRQAHGWTQQKLADVLDKPVRTIGRWERGEYQPRYEDAMRLQDLLLKARKAKRKG
jgi:transcriptional regulator with XRE-family HTH domain